MIQTARKKILIIALPLIFLALVILNFKFFIKGTDWQNIFYPAVTSALKSGQPYSVTGFFNPPWVIPMLAPFVLLPAGWGASVFAVTGYFAFGFIAYKMGAKLPALIFFMLNPYTINHLLAPNAEWIAALGFILPPQIGLLFLMVKPQIGAFVAIFWFIEAWKRGYTREVIRVFWPITMIGILSLLVYPEWPLSMLQATSAWWNISFFPYGIPIGLVFMVTGISNKTMKYSIFAAPFLTPYFGRASIPTLILPLLSSNLHAFAALVGLWLIWLLPIKPF